MALAIDASTPAIATQTNSATATVTTASFTPPAGSVLLIGWSGNSQSGTSPASPTITDNLGVHLTYTLLDWQSRANAPTVNGQAADWVAVVGSSAAMTVTVTTGSASGLREAALCVTVLTGADTSTPIGAHSKTGSGSASSISQSYTASATGGQGFLVVCDWDAKGNMTAGTGCTLQGTGSPGGQFSYGFTRRTSADDVSGVSNTLNTTLGGSSINVSWVWAEVLPGAAAAVETNYAGPFRGPAPGYQSPTGLLTPPPADPNIIGVAVPAEAAGTGVSLDVQASVSPAADQTAGAGTALAATPDTAVNTDTTTGSGTALDGQASISPAADTTAGAGVATDAAPDLAVNADQATGSATAYDATVLTVDGGQVAGPWLGPVPGYQSPTGRLAALVGDAQADNQAAADVAAGAGAAYDASVAVTVAADVTTATSAGLDATVTVTTNADIGSGAGTGLDAQAAAAPNADTTAATGSALDASTDTTVNADTTTGTGAGYDAVTDAAQPAAGPWTAPTPGRLGPTGQWTVQPGDLTPPAVTVSAETTTAAGTGYDATVAVGPAADMATGSATALAPGIDQATAAALAAATGAGLDAVLALAAAVEVAIGAGTAITGTTTGAVVAVNAASTPTVTAGRTGAPTATARRTSTSGVTARRTSTPDISDG